MAKQKPRNVTMRVRIGESELEVAGPSSFVEKKIAEFVELNKHTPLTPAYSPKGGASLPAPKAETRGKSISPAQFFRRANTHTDVDRTLLAGYYIEMNKGSESFTASEAKDLIRAAKITPPKNTNDSINSNIKKGLMMSAGDKDGKRAFVLTSDGEDAVNDMLQK